MVGMNRLLTAAFLCGLLIPCAHGDTKTITYDSDDQYVGEARHKWGQWEPHGQGTKTYANGSIYAGQWKYGKKKWPRYFYMEQWE